MQFLNGGYAGEKEAFRDLAGMRLIESRYTRQVAMKKHSHRFAFLHIVLRGTTREESSLPVNDLSVAEAVFHPARSPHATVWQGDSAGFAVEFGAGIDSELRDRLAERPVALPISQVSGLMIALRREAYRADNCASLAAECYAAEILSLVEKRSAEKMETQTPQWLRQAREMIYDSGVIPLSLTQIARTVQIHPVHLSRAFRQHYQETLGDCLRRRRIQFACQQIGARDIALTEIAQEAGFADHAHFSRTFRHYIGMTPSEYLTLLKPQSKRGKDCESRKHGGQNDDVKSVQALR